jgi:hypothetical protein
MRMPATPLKLADDLVGRNSPDLVRPRSSVVRWPFLGESSKPALSDGPTN